MSILQKIISSLSLNKSTINTIPTNDHPICKSVTINTELNTEIYETADTPLNVKTDTAYQYATYTDTNYHNNTNVHPTATKQKAPTMQHY